MTLWTQAHINVDISKALKYLDENPTPNPAHLFESIKSDLSKEEDFDHVIVKGEKSFGKKIASNGNAKIINNNESEIEFEISFDYIGVSRIDNSLIGDTQKGCIFKFKANKTSKLITDYIYQQK